MEMTHFDICYLKNNLGPHFRILSNPSQTATCSSKVNPKFQNRSKHKSAFSGKSGFEDMLWSGKSSCWRNCERLIINARAFSTLRIGLRCHMRSTFEEIISRQKMICGFIWVLDLFGWWWFPDFQKSRREWKDFGSRQRWKMLVGCWFRSLANWINEFRLQPLSFTMNLRKPGFYYEIPI